MQNCTSYIPHKYILVTKHGYPDIIFDSWIVFIITIFWKTNLLRSIVNLCALHNNGVYGGIQILRNTTVTLRTLCHSATSFYGGPKPRLGGSVTLMMLWLLATTNCGGLRPQIPSVISQKLLSNI